MGEALGILSPVCFRSSLTHNSLHQDPGSRQLWRCQGATGLPAWEQPQWGSDMLSAAWTAAVQSWGCLQPKGKAYLGIKFKCFILES